MEGIVRLKRDLEFVYVEEEFTANALVLKKGTILSLYETDGFCFIGDNEYTGFIYPSIENLLQNRSYHESKHLYSDVYKAIDEIIEKYDLDIEDDIVEDINYYLDKEYDKELVYPFEEISPEVAIKNHKKSICVALQDLAFSDKNNNKLILNKGETSFCYKFCNFVFIEKDEVLYKYKCNFIPTCDDVIDTKSLDIAFLTR